MRRNEWITLELLNRESVNFSEDKCTQMWMEKAKMVENGWKWGEPVLGNPNTGLSFPSDTENGFLLILIYQYSLME